MTAMQQQHQTGGSTRLSTSKLVNKVKGYRVLGDYEEYEVKLAQVTVAPPPPEPDTVDNTDSAPFPPEVWQAAAMSPDRGTAIIRAFRDVLKTRTQYQAQLTNIHTLRQAKLASLTNPGGSLGAYPAGAPKTLTGTLGSVTLGGQPLRYPRGTLPSLAAATLQPSIGEAIKEGSEPRRLELFAREERRWEETANAVAAAAGRPVYDLAMQRGPEWRAKREALEALERAMPIEDRMGGVEAWNMSLRDAWERIVPVGNMFSGLCAVVRDKPTNKPIENFARIGRPLDPPTAAAPAPPPSTLFTTALQSLHRPLGGTATGLGFGTGRLEGPGTTGGYGAPVTEDGGLTLGSKTAKAGRSLTLRGRDWQRGDWLKTQTELYAKNIRKLFPNDPDMKSLAVKGQALEGQLEEMAFAPITLQEVESHLEATDRAAYDAYMAVKQRLEDERLAAQAEADAAEAAAAAAAAAAGPQPGPHLRLSSPDVQMTASFSAASRAAPAEAARRLPSTSPSPSTTFATFTLSHFGTAALYFTWHASPPALSPFALSRPTGAIVPGETVEFPVVFTPPAPGLYCQQYVLSTSPQLPEWQPLTVTVRGMCMPEDTTGEERRALDGALYEAEKMRKVHAALERILADVSPAPPPPRPPAVPAAEEAECASFERANADVVPPVFYNPQRYAELAAMYQEALAKVRAAAAPPPEENEKAKKKDKAPAKEPKKGSKEEAAALAAAEAAAAAAAAGPQLPDTWDSSLPTLRQALEVLHRGPAPPETAPLAAVSEEEEPKKGPDAALAAELSAKVDVIEADMRVPPNGHVLLRHAANRMLRQVSEAVAAKLASVRADYDGRKAEQEARQAEAAAAGGSAAAAPGAVDEKWRADKSRAGAKAVLKAGVVPGLVEESSRALGAVGDALEARLRLLDARIEELLAAGGGDAANWEELEEAQWQRFGLLRTWVRLGVPPRPPYVC